MKKKIGDGMVEEGGDPDGREETLATFYSINHDQHREREPCAKTTSTHHWRTTNANDSTSMSDTRNRLTCKTNKNTGSAFNSRSWPGDGGGYELPSLS